jgi:hypothetical protein
VILDALLIELPEMDPTAVHRLTRIIRARVVARDAQLAAAYAPPATREALLVSLDLERRLPGPVRGPRPSGADLDSPVVLAERRMWLETMHEVRPEDPDG